MDFKKILNDYLTSKIKYYERGVKNEYANIVNDANNGYYNNIDRDVKHLKAYKNYIVILQIVMNDLKEKGVL